MEKKSTSNFQELLTSYREEKRLPEKVVGVLLEFCQSFAETIGPEKIKDPRIQKLLIDYIQNVQHYYQNPYHFEHFHHAIHAPYDFYQFGIDFLEHLVDKNRSSIVGKDRLFEIENHLRKGHNVVFLANHQIEADPQAISLLLQEGFKKLAQEMIFVAGERVITDPVAIPFSLGRNLLCIYSKRYIDFPPKDKHQKQLHNKKTMQIMSQLLKDGGKCIYVAPSGGRDRKDKAGQIQIAEFDPASIEMFYLMAKKSRTPTYFYPMALKTYDLLPPPEIVQIELGEKRSLKRSCIHMAIGEAIDMENFPGSDTSDKHLRRKVRSDYIWNLVKQDYNSFTEEK